MLFASRFRSCLSYSVLKSLSRHSVRFCSTNSEFQDVRKIRRFKRVFAFGLFGLTLASAYYVKKKRAGEHAALFGQATYLKNYDFGNLKLYQFKDYVLPESVLKSLKEIQKFEFKESDILVSSFPKTGTTWIQEIIYLIATDLDYDKATATNISDRFPYLEYPVPGLTSIRQQQDPRFIKTHLPVSLLFEDKEGPKPRVVSILRNPLDVAVSYYYFARMNSLISYNGNFDDFFEVFIRDKVPYGPLWKHYVDTKYFLDDSIKKDSSNVDVSGGQVLIVYFEKLIKNFDAEIDRISKFLGKEHLLSAEEKIKLKKHCSFEEMKENPTVNYKHWDSYGLRREGEAQFMRKGAIGDWKNHLTRNQFDTFERWLFSNFPDIKDFEFEYE